MYGYDATSPIISECPMYDSCGPLGTTYPPTDSQEYFEGNGLRPHTPEVLTTLVDMPDPTCSYFLTSSPQSILSPSSPSTSSCSVPSPVLSRPPSVQATMSLLVKEGLKMAIHTRRNVQGKNQVVLEYREPHQEKLTEEDEMRRRRRRERNKIAATKCRNKKKERTHKLAIESDHLEVNNVALRTEIHNLELERQELLNLLTNHLPRCCLPSQQNSCAQPHATYPCPIV
ncbi:jun dimerization protein 2-like [Limulus polyphemus]|uniref:Jun dimerization protein 2-like n=1 Tax=Limulus polyphemus TaxID=6850 RepID=A0ABM1BAV4_LIMPO|nr:jun dimerization protein 2-like [Limulus polyphemus]